MIEPYPRGLEIPWATTNPREWSVVRLFGEYGRAHIEANAEHVKRNLVKGATLNAGRLITACRRNWAGYSAAAHAEAKRRKAEAAQARAEAQRRRVEEAQRVQADAEAIERARAELRRRMRGMTDAKVAQVLAECVEPPTLAFLSRGNRGPKEIALSASVVNKVLDQLRAIDSGEPRRVIDLTA